MRTFFCLIWLHIRRLFSRPLALLLFFVLPLLLTIPAGLSVVNNDASRMALAICDLAQNAESRALLADLKAQNTQWVEMSEPAARLALEEERIQALVLIPEHFSLHDAAAGQLAASDARSTIGGLAALLGRAMPEAGPAEEKEQSKAPSAEVNSGERDAARDSAASLRIASGSQPEALLFVREELSAQLVAKLFEAKLLARLEPLAAVRGVRANELRTLFTSRVAARKASVGDIGINFYGLDAAELQSQALMQLPRYNIELLFLSLFVLMALFSPRSPAFAELLSRSPRAYAREELAEILALMLLGVAQLFSLHLVMSWINPQLSWSFRSFAILLTFLLWQITLASLFRFLPPALRLLGAMLYTLLSALLGGCLLSLPSPLLRAFARFSPHAWATAELDGMQLLDFPCSALLALLLLLGSNALRYFLQKSRLADGSE